MSRYLATLPSFLMLCLFCFSGYGASRAEVPHLELELTGFDYRAIFAKPENKNLMMEYMSRRLTDDDDLNPVIDAGKKFLDWVILINQNRPASQQISLSSAATEPAYPITKPGKSNPKIILTLFSQFKSWAPAWLKAVVFENKEMSTTLPTSQAEFAEWGRKLVFIYQKASRWILQEPYLFQYGSRKSEDLRGYYFLTQDAQIETKLKNYYSLTAAQKSEIAGWLVNLCAGTNGESSCQSDLNSITSSNGDVASFFHQYVSGAKERWDHYFRLGAQRSDIDWTSNDANNMKVPFQTPDRADLKELLAVNIEDEWKWQDWHLKLAFQDGSGFGTPHLVLEAGATPHVDGVGGNTITMDGNAPTTEYDVRWTIRHEFGHVLGFEDCYIEFYDENEKAMINYQLDITNLMCSRQGKLKQSHYDELKANYYK